MRLLEELQYRDEDPPLSKSLSVLEDELMKNELAEVDWAKIAGSDAEFWPSDRNTSIKQKCRIAVGCQTDESEFAQIVELRDQTRAVMEEIA
eukprot:CAMPEP_0118951506 /NCGR_PEP_ID=MMETSP1169-20130426/53249_1 /TAXON_ID=36882 /ORGANISM="Pyramimonas obovata, Strain CCMP722" /LENGTH=91 /DNA_ID=CAMNT_0006898575 /DNA_START=166 /DNA_END=437 /DNA_ORIENTATION=-